MWSKVTVLFDVCCTGRSVEGNVPGERLGRHQRHVFTGLRVWFNKFTSSGMAQARWPLFRSTGNRLRPAASQQVCDLDSIPSCNLYQQYVHQFLDPGTGPQWLPKVLFMLGFLLLSSHLQITKNFLVSQPIMIKLLLNVCIQMTAYTNICLRAC